MASPLESTSASRAASDTAPARVAPGFEPAARLFERLMRAPGRGGGALVVRRGEEVLLDVWGGVADPLSGRPWTRDTLGLSFSTGKGVAATVIHRLADQGLIEYARPVSDYWPEFAAGGKRRITVAQLLTHQAGLDALIGVASDLRAMLDHLAAERRLASLAPRHQPGVPAYHTITYGWLLAGLARAVTGLGMEELTGRELRTPLGVDGLHFGRPRAGSGGGTADGERVAAFVGSLGRATSLAPLAVALVRGALPGRRVLESVYVPGIERLFSGERPPVLDTEMPAANGLFDAASLAALYAALAGGGALGSRRLLSALTVSELARVRTRALDRNLMVRMGWRLGYHQAFIPGVRLPRAFGHYGLSGSGAWADPDSGLALAFVSNRIYALSAPFGDLALVRLSRVAVQCARRAGM
jgi:CubicO group peptidase (beta-lactamase class C family)